MKVIHCPHSVIVGGTRRERRKWEEEHPEYGNPRTFRPVEILYKGLKLEDPWKGPSKEEKCKRRAAEKMMVYEMYGK